MANVATNQPSAADLNLAARNLILDNAIRKFQPLYSAIVNPSQQPTLTIVPKNAGMLQKFVVRVTAKVTNTDAALDLSLTDFGLSNLFSKILFTDLQNNERINCPGWFLNFVNSTKHKKPYGSGFLLETDGMSNFGETYPVIQAPATIAHGTNATIAAAFDIPIAYADNDLRGAIFSQVVSAQTQLQLTFSTAGQLFTAANTDSTFAMYKGTASATLTEVNVEVYQVFLDQLPIGQNGTILPLADLGTSYLLNVTQFGNIPQGQEYPVDYATYRNFLSTAIIFNHDTSGDTGRAAGTDINYFSLKSANYTNLWQKSPMVQALGTREILGCDPPKGCYYFPSRRRPINVNNFGNMQLVVNPSTSTVNSMLYVGWEMLAYSIALTNAGSLR